jgi:hypothetical protein
MLSVDPLKRQYSNSILFKKTMEKLWKEALSEPINPLTKKQKIKNFMKKTLVKMGIFDKLKSKITKN